MTPQDIGIAIAALASLSAVGIQLIRLRIDTRHIIARLSASEPDWEEPTTAHITAAVFNRGRPAFIDGMYLHLGSDHFWLGGLAKENNKLPADVSTGRSHRISFGLSSFEARLDEAAAIFSMPVRYKREDLPRMRLRVTDGEGHEHWADLTKDSVRNIREVIRYRVKDEAERGIGPWPEDEPLPK